MKITMPHKSGLDFEALLALASGPNYAAHSSI